DGGFSRYYQKTTGIAGYTLTYDSRGLYIVAHEPFVSLQKAIEDNADIKATIDVQDILATKGQMTIRDTDKGKELEEQIASLEMLVQAYEYGMIKEDHRSRLVKISTSD
ncbi:MAG: fructose-bisphosphatase class III, partial [Clostridia bacterium]|nr:fructose-bisphosphatase class III [Clostridia bacterium]